MLGRKRRVRAPRREPGFRLRHGLYRLREQPDDRLEGRIALDELAGHARQQPFNLLAEPGLGETDDCRALAQLGLRVGAPVALHVKGGGDNLPLLLGERLDLATTAATTAATATLGLCLAEVAPERTDTQEK